MRWIPGTSNIYGNSEFVITRSTDNGLTWHNMTGAPSSNLTSIDAVRINESTIYGLAVTYNRDVYKMLDTARIIGIGNPVTNTIPTVFNLYQNYPNPFNPVTRIRFSIPKISFVQLRIYDVLGKIKEVMVNEQLHPAEFETVVDASNYSSGTYFFQLIADGKVIETKKMIVLK